MTEKLQRTVLGAAVCAVLLPSFAGCGPGKKITYLHENHVTADLSLPDEKPFEDTVAVRKARRDTFTVHDFDGHEVIIMKAVRDDDGEMVAHDVIDAAVVTARFRNVAERHGKVDIQFNITVPPSMQDSRWQIRFSPDLFVMEDSLRLDPVIITGTEYRKAQLRGYQQYDRFLSSIVKDTSRFINVRQLEIFLQRNIPALYAFKTDSTFVSDEYFHSVFGVTEQEAVEHYTDKVARRINTWKKSRIGKMYDRYVKVPIVTEGIRLDTVIQAHDGNFIYCYTQTINTRPKLRQVQVVLSGEIYEAAQKIYTVPRCEPLTFYISSLSTFVDPTEKYLTKVLERRASANTACWIDFELGKADVREDYSNNATEIGRIKGNIADLLENSTYDIDSILVCASASPEGSWQANARLSQRRSQSVAAYMNAYIRSYQDSLERERGFSVDEFGNVSREARVSIPFIATAIPENWDMLDILVEQDTVLTDDQKALYGRLRDLGNPDEREGRLQKAPFYRHLRESLYPRVRTVRFDFYLHRKGMVKDTVHTTELDTVYMRGVQAIRDRDYETAITLLRPYNDFNTAIAYCSMDYNSSALAILEGLPKDAQVCYMLALLYSRQGDDEQAVEHYLHSIALEPSYRFRGNLDPEISALVKRYALDQEEKDEEDYYFN